MSLLHETLTVEESVLLVNGIAHGDQTAEAAFVERYSKPVRAMLLARSRNPDLTADLQQEVLMEALCALRKGALREPAKLTAFVLGIARNLLNNHFRTQGRQPETEPFAEEIHQQLYDDEHEETERREMAARAIDSLQTIDRSILSMTLVDGLKPAMIAERLRMTPDVVRQRKVRATRRVVEVVRQMSQIASDSHSTMSQKLGGNPKLGERKPGLNP
jgi:RNA polymerase sigma factor (sigma-70 family)